MLIVLIILAIVALDQFTKFLVVSSMVEHQTTGFIKGFMELTYKKNTGVAFGLLSEQRWLFMTFTAIMLVVMIAFLIKYRKSNIVLRISVAFLTGGGIGNMIDRLFRVDIDGSKFVVDFFEFSFVDFAIFNVADCFVTFGAILLAVYVLFIDHKDPIFVTEKPAVAIGDEQSEDDEIETEDGSSGDDE